MHIAADPGALLQRVALVVALVAVAPGVRALAGPPHKASPALAEPFERATWQQDYAFLRARLEESYANLAWFASPQGGVDLPALDRRTRRLLNAAKDTADAKAALLGFIAGFHDGHLARIESLLPGSSPALEPSEPEWNQLSARDGCAALGYAPVRSLPYSLPFESLRGTTLQSDGITQPFRAGIAISAGGTRFGIIRIPRFREQDSPPSICIQEWTLQQRAGGPINITALQDRISEAWFRTLADHLKRFQAEKVAAVIVDVGGNSGGNESGDWAPRLFTPKDVHSAHLWMSASPAAVGYFDEQLEELRTGLAQHPDASPEAIEAIRSAIAGFERRKASLGERRCSMSWVWREQRPWNPAGPSRLIDAGFASGQMDFLAAGALGGGQLATKVYWPAAVDAFRGAWTGPVYVLADAKTASSAEMFCAVLQDNGIAKIVGGPTAGDGGGFMFTEPPTELPHSHLRIQIPNCLRVRADGTNEVAGIRPDLPVLPIQGESLRARAARVLKRIDEDLGTSPSTQKAPGHPPN